MDAFKPLLAKVATGAALSLPEAEHAFDMLLSGEVTPAQMGGFLMGLRVRGESVEEITGAVFALRAKMLRVEAPLGAIDTRDVTRLREGKFAAKSHTRITKRGIG